MSISKITIDAIAIPRIVLDGETFDEVASDDDSGMGLNSRLSFTAVPGTTYFIFATTAILDSRGRYRLTVSTGFLEEI